MIWSAVLMVMTINLGLASTASARRCFVCGHGANDIFQLELDFSVNKTPPSCTWFNGIAMPLSLAKECPDGYLGCLTQISGDDVMRTCDPLALNDCKTANGIKYCYCNEDLCNSHDQESDDEEYGDYSGHGSAEDNLFHRNLPTSSDKNDEDFHFKDEKSSSAQSIAPKMFKPSSVKLFSVITSIISFWLL